MKPDSKIVCVGVGGEGVRFLNFRIAGKIVSGAIMEDRYIAVDTDAATLMCAWAPTRVQIGGKALLGLGTGGDMEAGRSAAEASQEVLLALFKQVKAEATKEIRLFAGLHGGKDKHGIRLSVYYRAVPRLGAGYRGLGARLRISYLDVEEHNGHTFRYGRILH